MQTTDHYSRRMRVAERAVKLAKRIDALARETELIEFSAYDGRKQESADDGIYSDGWTGLEFESANAANQLTYLANALREAAKSAGLSIPEVTP